MNLESARRKIFALAKQLKKEKIYINWGYFIKQEVSKILMIETKILAGWREYFDGLLNEENPNVIKDVECIEGP